MHTILVVEDNPVICHGIAQMIDCENLPVSVAELAFDGEEAKKKFSTCCPDIVITDIRMPRCSGLELMSWIREQSSETQIIVISSYDDFSYAQKAIKAGSAAYLLKPTNPAELNDTIRKALTQYDRIHNAQQTENETVTSIYSACMHGDTSRLESLPDTLSTANIYVASVLSLPHQRSSIATYAAVFSSLKDTFYITRRTPYLELVFPLCGRNFRESPSQYLKKLFCETLAPIVGNTQFLIGISDGTESVTSLSTALSASLEALIYTLYFKKKESPVTVLFHHELPIVRTPQHIRKNDTEFCILISAGDSREACALLRATAHTVLQENCTFTTLQTVLSRFASLLDSLNQEPELADALSTFSKRESYLSYKSADIAIDALCKLCESVSRQFAHEHGTISEQIEYVKSFILHNYSSQLTLENIAQRFHVSPNYLATQFKKNTGTTVNGMITRLRIEHSMELLQNSAIPLHTIATTIGYENLEYFFRVFKKSTGMTPGEYRACNVKESER